MLKKCITTGVHFSVTLKQSRAVRKYVHLHVCTLYTFSGHGFFLLIYM